MRPEKEYLIKEASDHLEKSTFFFLTDYKGINSEETSELRAKLAERGAEFHVVKNTSLRLAAKEKNLPDLGEFLSGHTAIVVGGDDASGVGTRGSRNPWRNRGRWARRPRQPREQPPRSPRRRRAGDRRSPPRSAPP